MLDERGRARESTKRADSTRVETALLLPPKEDRHVRFRANGRPGAPAGCYYGAYLQARPAPRPPSSPASAAAGTPAHDEMLFITVHQVYELWFKQILHELTRIEADFSANPVDDRVLGRIIHGLHRMHEILKLLVHQLDVMETMTPLDFLDFRDLLYPASGFQSAQFREIEIRLGLPQDTRLTFDRAPFEAKLSDADRERLAGPRSGRRLLALLDRWLARTPFVDWGGTPFREAYRAAVVRMLDRRRSEKVRGDALLSPHQRAAEALPSTGALKNFAAIFDEEAAGTPGACRAGRSRRRSSSPSIGTSRRSTRPSACSRP